MKSETSGGGTGEPEGAAMSPLQKERGGQRTLGRRLDVVFRVEVHDAVVERAEVTFQGLAKIAIPAKPLGIAHKLGDGEVRLPHQPIERLPVGKIERDRLHPSAGMREHPGFKRLLVFHVPPLLSASVEILFQVPIYLPLRLVFKFREALSQLVQILLRFLVFLHRPIDLIRHRTKYGACGTKP